MTANTPIVNAGLKYVNGLHIAKTDDQVITLGQGAARDSQNINDIILSSDVSINGLQVGANGVDLAVLAASSLYAVYVIGDSTAYKSTAGLLSLDYEQPSLPSGYDMFRRVGWIKTDGSSNVLQFWQYGEGQDRTYYYDVGIGALSAGAAVTFTEVDLSTSVPPIATEVLFDYTFTAGVTTDVAEFLPFGSVATSGNVRVGTGVAAAQVGMVTVPCQLDDDVPKVLYKVVSGDTLDLLTVGFKDTLQ